MSAARVALLAGLLVSAPAVIWAAGLVLQGQDVATPLRLAPAVEGLWLVQALCVAVLLPACVTLWTVGEAAVGALVFVLFPLPLLSLVWLTGSLPASTLLGGVLALACAGSLALAMMCLLRALASRAPAWSGLGVLLQVGLGSVIVVFRDTWMGWAGL